VSDLLLVTFVVVFNTCTMAFLTIRQHRRTKNAALAIIDGQWALVVGREDTKKLMYLRRLVEQMTMAETLGMSAKEPKRHD
jgi:hypothetical protein